MDASRDISRLIEIIAALRAPGTGCIWTRQQTNRTTVRYTLGEVQEVADAIARDDSSNLKEELGDLLYHIVLYAQIARENGEFDFGDIVETTTKKLLRRHPHVFGGEFASTPEEVDVIWQRVKAEEAVAKAGKTQSGRAPD